MSFNIDSFVKLSPVIIGLLIALIYWMAKLYNKSSHKLEDVFIVGITGSSLPSAFVLIYAAIFDINVIVKLSSAPIYVALAGLAVIYLACRTIIDKFNG